MKIVFVIPDMPGGGTERVVALLSNEYAKKGHSVSIMLFAGKQTAYALDDRIEVISMAGASSGSLRIRLKRLKNMREYFKKKKECLIYSFAPTPIPAIINRTGISFTVLRRYWYARQRKRRKAFRDI